MRLTPRRLERRDHQNGGPQFPGLGSLRRNLTAYDAAFVVLAPQLDAALVTLEKQLAAAPALGAQVTVP